MSWDAPLIIFEDEDEDELINEFIRLSALYPAYEPFEIAQVVFENLKDPTFRANHAAMKWSSNLSIKKRIDEARAGIGITGEVIKDKDDWERRVLATIQDATLNAQEKKVRIDGYNAIAKVRGYIDGEDDNKRGAGGVVLNFIRDPRSDAAVPDAA
jgi:hypothetical protein